ncbi:MAG: hypothetical protein U0L92_01450 [Clostridia bacterium]|nr:hypothetical protein [Clostridia bacterium]
MKKTLRGIAAGLAVGMVMMACSGCGKDVSNSANVDLSGEIPETLSIFSKVGGNVTAAGGKTFNDCMTFQLLEEKTGCHIDWIHPATGANIERFNMMMVSGEYPDAIVYDWKNASGGTESYLNDGVIVDLTPYIETCMPNFHQLLEEHPEFKKDVITDDGKILTIPYIRLDPELCVFQGTLVRQDWLDKLNLKAPTNAEELYNVLQAFKTQDPNGNGEADEVPMSGVGFDNSMGIGCLLWAFGTTWEFHLQDDQVVYGPITDEFKEGLGYMAKLFSEGLIDSDYMTNDRAKYDAKFTRDQVGFGFGYQPSTYYPSMNDGTKRVEGIGYLKAADGKNYCYNTAYTRAVNPSTALAVTTVNQNVAGTLKWLDNLFGGEGLMYANYGKEGLSYEMKDGEPVFTEYMTANPNGKTLAQMVGLTCAVRDSDFPMLQTWEYYKQTLQPWGIEAIENWIADEPVTANICPSLTLTPEENAVYTEKMSNITTYVQENANKVITGRMSIEEWDGVVETLKEMGIDEVIAIENNAYQRYCAR